MCFYYPSSAHDQVEFIGTGCEIEGKVSANNLSQQPLHSQVVEEDGESLRLNTKVLDDDTRAADDLPWLAFPVNLAQTSPGA